MWLGIGCIMLRHLFPEQRVQYCHFSADVFLDTSHEAVSSFPSTMQVEVPDAAAEAECVPSLPITSCLVLPLCFVASSAFHL